MPIYIMTCTKCNCTCEVMCKFDDIPKQKCLQKSKDDKACNGELMRDGIEGCKVHSHTNIKTGECY